MKTTVVLIISAIMSCGLAVLSPKSLAAEPIELEGLIEPYLVVNVGSSVPGILDMVKVDRGDLVKKARCWPGCRTKSSGPTWRWRERVPG